MTKEPLNNPAIDDDAAVASRRKFLKQLAGGAVLAMGGVEVASAAVRHIIYPAHHRHKHAPVASAHKPLRPLRQRLFARHEPAPTPTRHFYGPSHRMLAFEHTHTGDKLRLTYFERGNYVEDALQEINYLLRDYHTDDIHPIDTALLDQLYDLKQALGINKPFHIVSGYRSPFTNAQLRRHSHGVAEHSFHMQGRAIDIRLEGVSARTIKEAALAMAKGGVGYYPHNNFVHLDTGDFRTW